MYAYDFEYDGRHLSEFGFMVCSFDVPSGAETADKGSEITLTSEPIRNGIRNIVTGIKYDETLTTTFQICKDPTVYDSDNMEITVEEFRALSRWLNRKEYLWFHSYDWDEPDKVKPWFRATFTLSRILIAQRTYGVELEMFTDSPFGYGEEIVKKINFTNGNLTAKFADQNDEIGDTYPEMKITCGASGTLILTDDVTNCDFEVANCTSGEIITLSGDTMIIESSNSEHDIANDFNYQFFCFGNSFKNKNNTITANMPCNVEIRYRPIYKDTL